MYLTPLRKSVHLQISRRSKILGGSFRRDTYMDGFFPYLYVSMSVFLASNMWKFRKANSFAERIEEQELANKMHVSIYMNTRCMLHTIVYVVVHTVVATMVPTWSTNRV